MILDRCVLSRGGEAIDMSLDHKPEDAVEYRRICAAGGYVSDGRVDGNLNLSRAIGDLAYKDNTSIPAADQKISAQADIRSCALSHNDECIIVACDGIWNSMTSQQVVDFVRARSAAQQHQQTAALPSELTGHRKKKKQQQPKEKEKKEEEADGENNELIEPLTTDGICGALCDVCLADSTSREIGYVLVLLWLW